MSRPTRDAWAMELAQVTAKRATCCRRAVGCVILNERGHVLATGYNGVAAGMPHCNETAVKDSIWDACEARQRAQLYYPNACDGATSPSGTNLEGCEAIHAEQNALLQCRDVHTIDTVYVTTAPCVTCVKLLLNTSCRRIVFLEAYPHDQARLIWERAGRVWEQVR